MKEKPIDHAFAAYKIDKQQGIIRITGNNERTMKLRKRDIEEIVTYQYISDEAVDAGLLLLDKRLNDESNLQQDKITVYSVATSRLIMAGEENIERGKFITILPRHMAMTDVEDTQEAAQSGKQSSGVCTSAVFNLNIFIRLLCFRYQCSLLYATTNYRLYNVLVKVVRAKLTGTWEGGGIEGKNT